MLLIKKVDKAIRSLNKTLTLTNLEQKERQLMAEQLNALIELKQYIESGSWLRSDARERFLKLLAYDFNYTKVAEEYGKSKESLRVSISKDSKKLEDLIGADIVEKILSGDIEDALSRIRANAGTLKLAELYPKEVLRLFPKGHKDNILSLSDCKAEADLLAELSLRRHKIKISSLDENKLAHLLSILKSSKEQDSYQRNFLIKYIQGQAAWDEGSIKQKKISVYAQDAIFDQYVFNQLRNAIASTKLALSSAYDGAEEELLLSKLKALKEIEKFVKSYAWIPESKDRTAKIAVLNALFNSNYDYQKVAEEFNVSLKQLENFISRESRNLLEILGQNTLDLILNSDVEAGMIQFYNRTDNEAALG